MNRVSAGSTDLFPPAIDGPTMDDGSTAIDRSVATSWSSFGVRVVVGRHQIRALAVVGPAQRRRTRHTAGRAPRVQTRRKDPAGVRTVRPHWGRGRKGPRHGLRPVAETGYMRHCSRASDMIRIDPWGSRRPFPGHPHHAYGSDVRVIERASCSADCFLAPCTHAQYIYLPKSWHAWCFLGPAGSVGVIWYAGTLDRFRRAARVPRSRTDTWQPDPRMIICHVRQAASLYECFIVRVYPDH